MDDAMTQALRNRAHRMLMDGRQHAAQALQWARAMLEEESPQDRRLRELGRAVEFDRRLAAAQADRERHSRTRFTSREMSLGAQRWE